MMRKVLLLAILLLIFAQPSFGGWSENLRLTFRGSEISPQVIARNDTVHVVWSQMGPNVSYLRSTDGGNSWGPTIDLNAPSHHGTQPTFNLAEHGLLVSWLDSDSIMGITSIGIRKSANGSSWSSPSYVYTQNPNHFNQPTSAVKGDSIFLVYYSYRNDSTGSLPFRSMHSYNYGASWSSEVTVGHPYSVEALPVRMIYCFGTLLFAWTGNPDSARAEVHIIGYRSTDAGRTWSDTIWISPNAPNWSIEVCLSCNNQTTQIAAVYMDYRNIQYAFHGDIFTAISDNRGFTWPNEYQATNNHTARRPQIDFVADTLITVWSDMRYYPNGYHEIVFNRSNDGGLSWLGEERITNTPDESYDPWVSFDNGKIHVVWWELVGDSNADIFYKNYTPDSIDNIEESELRLPTDFSFSAYPNPFNSSVLISVKAPESSVLSIYDITGREIWRCDLAGGAQQVRWEAKDSAGKGVASGVYLARVRGDAGQTGQVKLVLLK
jgi:hypothetical protein